jgi:hypothetical protein
MHGVKNVKKSDAYSQKAYNSELYFVWSIIANGYSVFVHRNFHWRIVKVTEL